MHPDESLLRRALDLARSSIGLASPNPHVGAVLASASGEVVGEGFHTYNGVKHAEILALERAGARARGATLYLNLEPCSHQGRTGPCADAVIAGGIGRVVCSTQDPNPVVSGQGFARLRAAGIQVETGLLEGEARKLNEGFARYIRHKIPLVTLKAAMTLDGKIAPPATDTAPATGWITANAARAHAQELRHAHDAILVGIGTVLADNPLLTDRSGKPRRRPLLRVILDSHLRLPLDTRLVDTAHGDVLVFCISLDPAKRDQLQQKGIRVEQIPADSDGRPDLKHVLTRLAELEVTSLILEGGALTNWTALSTGVADKVLFYYAPRILGGTHAIPFAAGEGFPTIGGSPYIRNFSLYRFGEDFAIEGYLRDPYA